MAKLGIAVVGLDHWYTAFAVLAEASKGRRLKLVGVSDPSRERLEEVKRSHSAGYVTTNSRKVIADPEVQLVCSLGNTRDNVKVVRAALAAGKHVACVKPMAMNLRQADEMIASAESRGCVLWSFDQLGRMRAAALRAIIKRGLIGQPISFHQTAWSGLPLPWPGRTGPSWWIDAKFVPFGAWADHAIYTIGMLRALFDAEVVRVHGEIANKRYPKLSVEDYGVGTLEFSNGVVAVLEHTWTGGPYYPSWTKIAGTHGVIHTESAAFGDKTMLVTAKGAKPLKLGGARGGGMLAPVLDFIAKGQANPSPARESRTNLAATFAVYRAAKTGRYVTL